MMSSPDDLLSSASPMKWLVVRMIKILINWDKKGRNGECCAQGFLM